MAVFLGLEIWAIAGSPNFEQKGLSTLSIQRTLYFASMGLRHAAHAFVAFARLLPQDPSEIIDPSGTTELDLSAPAFQYQKLKLNRFTSAVTVRKH